MIKLESASMTHVGLKRKRNEDYYLCDDSLNLYVVADGMGGHRAGDVASRLLIETLLENIQRPQNVEPESSAHDGTLSGEANKLLAAIRAANKAIYDESNRNQNYKGMGSTVSAVKFTDDTLITANVGDSPIYLIRNHDVEVLSTPHTLVAEQESFFPKDEMPIGREFGHVLTKAIGLKENVVPDFCEIQCFNEDIFVICSDGLSDKVTPEEIRVAAERNNPENACQTLVNLANERGGDDNITLIVILLKKVTSKRKGILGGISRFFSACFDGLN